MQSKPSTLFLAFKVWLYTNIVFALGVCIPLTLIAKEVIFFGLLAGVVSCIITSPLIAFLFIEKCLIRKTAYTITSKLQLIYIVCFAFCLPYSVIATPILQEVLRLNTTPIFILFGSAFILLIACVTIALCLLHKEIISYLSSSNKSIIMQQEFQNFAIPTFPAEPKTNTGNKIFFKALITGALVLLLLIPSYFVTTLVTEREARQKEVVKEVSSKWSEAQTISGPFFYIPYTTTETKTNGQVETGVKNLFWFPEQLETTTELKPEVRPRSIYNVYLYKSNIAAKGSFINELPIDIKQENLQLDKARICFSVSDFKGIEEAVIVTINGIKYQLKPGLPFKEYEAIKTDYNVTVTEGRSLPTASTKEIIGLSVIVPLSIQQLAAPINFSLTTKINGTDKIEFLPLAGNSKYNIVSTWPNPKFDGSKVPTTRKVNNNGFEASWSFTKANLPFGTCVNSLQDIKKETYGFGLSLLQPADNYAKTMRSVKYSILLISFTFALFFLIEIAQNKPVHPLQYLLVGIALLVFYTLLLSISEFILFDWSYLIAAFAVVSLIATYSSWHFKSAKTTAIFTLALSCLYAFVFVLVRLEDTALLIGSIGLFIVVGIAMYATKKINWYQQ
jgi:inner membrane protein